MSMRAHTVILGAGATIAAIPKGDKNGMKSSVMTGLISNLHLEDILKGIELNTKSDNLEDIYSELYSRPECKDSVYELEKRLYHYFKNLELPDSPTVYDFLILSLTKKDVIATFNWDPLLLQAYVRCHMLTKNLPHILCLHGNVAISYCKEHQEFGVTDATCPVCGKLLSPIKLLYPVAKKNYRNDDYIKACWDAVEYILENSYMLTIFGYSAPDSDKEAIKLLKKAWGSLENRQLEEVSIIDIISEKDMLKKWNQFIYSHHYRFATYQLNIPADTKRGFQDGMTWHDIHCILSELLTEEINTPVDKNLPLHYTRRNI